MLHLIAVLLGVSPVPASHQPKALDRASKVPLPIHHTLQNAFCFVNIVRNAVSYPEFFDVPHRRIRAWEGIIIILTNNRSFWQIFLPSSGSENKTRNSLPTLLLWRQLHPSCKACWPVNLPMSMQNWLVLAMAPPSCWDKQTPWPVPKVPKRLTCAPALLPKIANLPCCRSCNLTGRHPKRKGIADCNGGSNT